MEDEFRPLVLPTLKFATQQIYTLLLDKHLIPRFGEDRVGEISTPEVQRFILEKLKQGYAWETASHRVVQALEAHRSRCMDTSAQALVFSDGAAQPLSANNLRRKRLASACRRAEARRIDWHTLRRTYSTLLHSLGTPVKVRQSLLGHSTAAITMDVYTYPVSESERHAVARLNEILFPNVPNLHQDAAGVETGRVVTQ